MRLLFPPFQCKSFSIIISSTLICVEMNSYSVQLQQEKWHKSQERTNQQQRWSDVSLLETGLHGGSVGRTLLTNVREHLGADRALSWEAPMPRHLSIQNAFYTNQHRCLSP